MKRLIFSIIILLLSAAYIQVEAAQPAGSAYLDGGTSKYALILCHGRGKYPEWKVVDPLRKGVHEVMGWYTLSLQMPADDKDWKEYASDFPAAYKTIKEAIDFLKKEKKVTTIYLMGHSMGSRMASAFVAYNPDQPVKGLIVAGIRNNGEHPFNGKQNLEKVSIPVLDIWGDEGNGKDSRNAAERRDLISEDYTQIPIAGSNHKFDGYENRFVNIVVKWLESQTVRNEKK